MNCRFSTTCQLIFERSNSTSRIASRQRDCYQRRKNAFEGQEILCPAFAERHPAEIHSLTFAVALDIFSKGTAHRHLLVEISPEGDQKDAQDAGKFRHPAGCHGSEGEVTA
jgi:hypothetical protein